MRMLLAIALDLLAVTASAAGVSGRVVSDTRFPLPGATITTESGKSAISDAEGRFTLDVPEGRTVHVTAALLGFAPTKAVLCATADRDLLPELTLSIDVIDCCISVPEPRPVIHVGPARWRVTDLRDHPLAVATIAIEDEGGRIVTSGATDDGGRFQVDSLRAGRYRVEIVAPGFAEKTMLLPLSACSATNLDFIIRLAERCD